MNENLSLLVLFHLFITRQKNKRFIRKTKRDKLFLDPSKCKKAHLNEHFPFISISAHTSDISHSIDLVDVGVSCSKVTNKQLDIIFCIQMIIFSRNIPILTHSLLTRGFKNMKICRKREKFYR